MRATPAGERCRVSLFADYRDLQQAIVGPPEVAMDVFNENIDQRKSFRCGVAEVRQKAVLKVGTAALPVRLLDESAGGFAVEAEAPINVEEGAVGELYTGLDAYEVRIANIVELESAELEGETVETEAEPETETSAPLLRLGLQRLGEVEPTVRGGGWVRDSLRYFLGRLCSSGGSLAVVTVLLVLTVVVAPGVAVVLLWATHNPVIAQAVPWRRIGHRPIPPNKSSPQPSQPPRQQEASRRSALAFLARTAEKTVAEQSASLGGNQPAKVIDVVAERIRRLRRMVRSLPGAAAFTLPEVARELQLTDEQQQQFRRIVDFTERALRHVDRRLSGSSGRQGTKSRRNIFKAASEEALSVLTDEQRTRWEKLVGTSGQ